MDTLTGIAAGEHAIYREVMVVLSLTLKGHGRARTLKGLSGRYPLALRKRRRASSLAMALRGHAFVPVADDRRRIVSS